MDKESIIKLGLDYIKNIDLEKSDEIYDPTTNNHIIIVKLIKEDNQVCPYCGSIGKFRVRSSCTQIIKHASAIEDNLIIKFKRRIFICDCGRTFKEKSPFSETKNKNTIQKKYKVLLGLKNINASFTDVANNFKLSVTTVQNIFDSAFIFRDKD